MNSDSNFKDGKPHLRLINIVIGTYNFFMRVDPGEMQPKCCSVLVNIRPSIYIDLRVCSSFDPFPQSEFKNSAYIYREATAGDQTHVMCHRVIGSHATWGRYPIFFVCVDIGECKTGHLCLSLQQRLCHAFKQGLV